jgi:hypothetical protein
MKWGTMVLEHVYTKEEFIARCERIERILEKQKTEENHGTTQI